MPKVLVFKAPRRHVQKWFLAFFWPKFGRKWSHHVMDASCWFMLKKCVCAFSVLYWHCSNTPEIPAKGLLSHSKAPALMHENLKKGWRLDVLHRGSRFAAEKGGGLRCLASRFAAIRIATGSLSHQPGEETRTMLSEFPFLSWFTVLLISSGSNSPWSEFWSEFPHFMGMGVVPAPSTKGPKIEKKKVALECCNLAWKNSKSQPSELPTKTRGLAGGSLEMFNLAWKFQSRRAILKYFSTFGPLGFAAISNRTIRTARPKTVRIAVEALLFSSGTWRGAPDGVATLKVRKGAFDALNKGSGALGNWSKVVAPSGAPPEELCDIFSLWRSASNRRIRFASDLESHDPWHL